MFEFFFKYPAAAFTKGEIVFLGRWPVWLLAVAVIAVALLLAYPVWRRRGTQLPTPKSVAIWLMQTGLLALLLTVLWHPALSVATLRPQQNVVAVVVDDSGSMALREDGEARLDAAKRTLKSGVLDRLAKKFQVRLYRAGDQVQRVENVDGLKPAAPATRLGDAVKQVVGEASSLPLGAIVLLSDGADNAGGLDLSTMNEIRRYRIPVHTVGFGREKLERDIEIVEAELPARALADSRLAAQVTLRQFGYETKRARIAVRDGNKVLASRDIVLRRDGADQVETLAFSAGAAAAKALQVTVDPLDGEENRANNSLARLINVEGAKPRVLYIEGEPKWEYKFLRRAIEADQGLQLVSMIRTTQNKIYRQGVKNANDLEEGFPSSVDELFSYQGLIIGGVEANYFTTTQQELIRQFVDRRGGGVLFLGGRGGLTDGGWAQSAMADLLPVTLPNRKDGFKRDPANVELTSAGRDSLLCRLDDNPERNVDRWKKLPYLQGFQDVGVPKPGAAVLAEMSSGGRKYPLLALQNYGRGRTAVFATSGSWRWQMTQPIEDMSHEMFWQQMLRWIVSGTNGRVLASTPRSVYSDDMRVPLRVEARDRNYLPLSDAEVEARILQPDGGSTTVQLRPDPADAGTYLLDWSAERPGSYVMEVVAKRGEEEVGRDVLSFRREDGVSENFRTQQNRELLEKLSTQTGGRYYKPAELTKLADEIAYSEAGISTRETRDLWDMPILFLCALVLRSGEWLLRRKWGVV